MRRRIAPAICVLMTLALLGLGARAEDAEIRQRRREIEVEFAGRYMKVAKDARKCRDGDLASEAFGRAEELDPGNDDVIEFDPEVEGRPSSSAKRRLKRIRKAYRAVRLAEAKERLKLATWLDEEAWVEEAEEEIVRALSLAPGPVTFDAGGALSTPGLGEVPLALSLAALDGRDVYRGRLVPLDEIPPEISWSDGWKLETKHLKIQTNVSAHLCRNLARALGAARSIYIEETGFEIEERVTVYVLAKRSAFEEYVFRLTEERPGPGTRGRFKKGLCVVDGSRTERQAIRTALHEGAHCYYSLGHEELVGHDGVNMPIWFAEGLATYCAGYGEGSISYERGVVDPQLGRDEPLKRFKSLLKLGQARPLEEFMAHEEGDTRFYYEACAFYWFFKETGDEALRKLYLKSIRAVAEAGLSGEDRTAAGNAIFLKEMGGSLAWIQQAFFEWAAGLEFED